MIEKIIRDYLMPLISVPVYIDVPPEPGDAYVVIERTGGGEREHIRDAMVAIQSYGATKYAAASQHETVLDVMKGLTTLDTVSACDLNAEYDYTDTQTKRYRYQAVYDIVYY